MAWPPGSQDLSPPNFCCGELYKILLMHRNSEITSSMREIKTSAPAVTLELLQPTWKENE
jgi:hypothetical protein